MDEIMWTELESWDELADESEVGFCEECPHFLEAECLYFGAPCPSNGNAASSGCLMAEM